MKNEEVQKYLDELDNDELYTESLKKQKVDLSEFIQERSITIAHEKKQRVFKIKNEYIKANKTIELYEPLENDILIEMVRIKTQPFQDSINSAKQNLTKKVEAVLIKQVPVQLKMCYKKFKHAFIKHPGFMYQTTREYGDKKIWVDIDVPYYFEQFTEMSVIEKYAAYQRHILDKHVEMYHRYTEKLIRLEAKIAVELSGLKTVISLLEFDVDYYDMYMSISKKQKSDKIINDLTEQEKLLK